jgi:hypothetical protein
MCNTATGVCTYSADSCSTVGCQTGGTCNPNTGACSGFAAGTCPLPTGCQTGGTCNANTGACSSFGAGTCPPPTGCQTGGTCNASTGACTYTANSGACPQPVGCQTGGTCNAMNGTCSALVGDPCTTPPSLQCLTLPGTCAGSSCSYTPNPVCPDSTICDPVLNPCQ